MRFFSPLNLGVYLAVMQCQECSQNLQGKPNESVRQCMTTRVASSLSSSNKNKTSDESQQSIKKLEPLFSSYCSTYCLEFIPNKLLLEFT
jgi:hypothetical protein